MPPQFSFVYLHLVWEVSFDQSVSDNVFKY